MGSKMAFATLFFPREELRMMVPKKTLNDNVRPPIGEKEALKVLDYLQEWDGSLSKQWKVRQRNNQERLESGDPIALSQVYKGLRRMQDKKGQLNTSDQRQLALSEALLVEILTAALDSTPESVEEKLAASCEAQAAA